MEKLQIDQTAVAKITFDPSVWFSGISPERLDNASLDGSGVIVISETKQILVGTEFNLKLKNGTLEFL